MRTNKLSALAVVLIQHRSHQPGFCLTILWKKPGMLYDIAVTYLLEQLYNLNFISL